MRMDERPPEAFYPYWGQCLPGGERAPFLMKGDVKK